MIISTPNWNQEFPDLIPQANGDGSDGEDGKDGIDGPQGRYYRTNKEHKDSLQRGATTWTSPPKLPSGFPAGRSFVCCSGKVL